MESFSKQICSQLKIDSLKHVEIESKKRILPEQVKDIRKFLLKQKKSSFDKKTFFFDQFLDTPHMALFKAGASLRLRYKKGGTKVYLQYKGPGVFLEGILFRSEFSSERLKHLILEESHHDVIHFKESSLRKIIKYHVSPAMRRAMETHLGKKTIQQIRKVPILSMYQKEKFVISMGRAYLEPSLDRVYAFHILPKGIHPLSSFCEYENEIKASGSSLSAKIERLPDLIAFEEKIADEFGLKPERLDKYHRCASIFKY